MGDTERRFRCRLPIYVAGVDLRCIMATPETMVFVIDDDPSFRRSTAALIGSAGFNVHAFSSAEEFFA